MRTTPLGDCMLNPPNEAPGATSNGKGGVSSANQLMNVRKSELKSHPAGEVIKLMKASSVTVNERMKFPLPAVSLLSRVYDQVDPAFDEVISAFRAGPASQTGRVARIKLGMREVPQ